MLIGQSGFIRKSHFRVLPHELQMRERNYRRGYQEGFHCALYLICNKGASIEDCREFSKDIAEWRYRPYQFEGFPPDARHADQVWGDMMQNLTGENHG